MKHLTKLSRARIQTNKIRNEKRDIAIGTEAIQRIIKSYLKSFYSKYWKNLNDTDNSLNKYHLSKSNLDQVN